jgi:hypothetical protein
MRENSILHRGSFVENVTLQARNKMPAYITPITIIPIAPVTLSKVGLFLRASRPTTVITKRFADIQLPTTMIRKVRAASLRLVLTAKMPVPK